MTFRLPLLLVAVLAAVTGCTGHGAVKQDVAGSNGYQTGDAALRFIAAGSRHEVGPVTGTLLDGHRFDLSAWRGHVVVVNFWGSWCAPCQAEADALEQVARDTRPAGVEFLGVDVRDDRASATAFERSHHISYPSLDDPANTVALRFRGVPPDATPTTIVLDREGRIAARQSGEILYTQLRDVVARVTAEKA